MEYQIYHICRVEEWEEAQNTGLYYGSSQDLTDGFIHFSTRVQIAGSAKKHRKGQTGLILLTVDPETLGDALRWEKSRGGDFFPHLYAPLLTKDVFRRDFLKLGDDELHIFPNHVAL